MTPEENYYYNKASQERIYSDLQHQSIMSKLIDEETFAVFRMIGARLFKDGNQWCCLYGDNIQVGICGFGDTPMKAVIDFNRSLNKP